MERLLYIYMGIDAWACLWTSKFDDGGTQYGSTIVLLKCMCE